MRQWQFTHYDTPPLKLLSLLSTDLSFDKVKRLLSADHVDTARLVDVADTVALFCYQQHLGTESRADELAMLR